MAYTVDLNARMSVEPRDTAFILSRKLATITGPGEEKIEVFMNPITLVVTLRGEKLQGEIDMRYLFQEAVLHVNKRNAL